MARARSPDSIEAERLYRDGMKLTEIAEKIGVPAGTVRRWKSTQGWDNASEPAKKKQTERSEKKSERSDSKTERKPNARKENAFKKGAPKGNQNAKGHGAPLRNQNALKHGAYVSIFLDSITDDEWEMVDAFEDLEEKLILDELKLISIRERRLMTQIKKYKEESEKNKGMLVKGHKKTARTKYDGRADIESNNKKDINAEITETSFTEVEAAMESIMKLEAELTKVQRAKTKMIDSLINYRLQWKRNGGTSETKDDILIYLPDNKR